MCMHTPIEYCDLTGAGTLNLRPNMDEQGGWWCIGAFEGCDKLKTLIIDSVEAHWQDDEPYELDDNDKSTFKDCTSLKTIIINDKTHEGISTGERQIDALRLYLSKCGLNTDNIDIKFK